MNPIGGGIECRENRQRGLIFSATLEHRRLFMTKQDRIIGLEDALAILKRWRPNTFETRIVGRHGWETTPTSDTSKLDRAIAAVEVELNEVKNDL